MSHVRDDKQVEGSKENIILKYFNEACETFEINIVVLIGRAYSITI